jgi:hypothetical protein
MQRKITLPLALLALLSACAPSEKQQAERLLADAQNAYAEGRYNQAQLLLDSLKEHYPRQVEARRAGLELTHTLEYETAQRTRAYADSMLLVVGQAIDSLAADFDYVKTEYDDFGRYLPKGTGAEHNLRSYLHAAVDDYGKTQLIASYRGAGKLGFTTVRLSAADGTACTTAALPYDDANNYHYQIQGTHYETLTFSPLTDGGVLGYAALHARESLTLTYLGGTSPLNVALSASDLQALQRTYQMADLLQNRLRIMQELTVAANTILHHEQRNEE